MSSVSSGPRLWLSVSCAVAVAVGCRAAPQPPAVGVAPPIVDAAVGPLPGPPEDDAGPANPFSDDEVALMEGRRFFLAYNCAGCHGEHGGGGMGPSLRDAEWIYGDSDARIAKSIAEGRAWVALDPAGQPGAVAQIDRINRRQADLALMFVAPENMGHGLGRALFVQACKLARERGARELLIDSDPQAAGFYAAMGATRIGAAPTGHGGRLLPRFSINLALI